MLGPPDQLILRANPYLVAVPPPLAGDEEGSPAEQEQEPDGQPDEPG